MDQEDIDKRQEEVKQGDVSTAALAELDSKFQMMEDNIYNMWKGSVSKDTQAREDLWIRQNILTQIRNSFTKDINISKMAKIQLAEKD